MSDRDPKAVLPIHDEEHRASRRSVLDAAIAGSFVALGASALYPIVRFISAPPAVDSGALEVIAGKVGDVEAGTAIAFRFGDKPALLVRDEGGNLRAFIAICTHLDCVVQYRKDFGHIWCACHNGHFDLSGRNIEGPPPRPLAPLAVEVRGDEVIVRRA
jgi:cytochrome b6-f complex iron-sulfur subunit